MRTLYYNWLLDELVTRFGESAVDRMLAVHANQTLVIPNKPTQSMINGLGQDVAEWLVDARGGYEVLVPSKKTVQIKRDRQARNHDIRTSNEKLGVLAKRYDLSRRQIINIRAQT